MAAGLPVAAQSIADTQALSFGHFVAGAGGSVTMSPSGTRSQSGGVVLLGSGPGAVGQFQVTGTPSATYAITLPNDGVVTLSNGAVTMAVNGFASFPAGTGQLSTGGSQTLSVGATLSVGSGQQAGSYSGSFDITVNYN